MQINQLMMNPQRNATQRNATQRNAFPRPSPPHRSSEVYLYLRTNLILSVPFLRQCSPEVVQELVMRLKSEIFLPADYIVHKGAPGAEMFLISKGICEVTITDIINPVKKEEANKPKRRRDMGRRRSSVDALKGMKDNFTDFLQQRNLKAARDKEAGVAPLKVDPDTNLPEQRKTYTGQDPKAVQKMRLKTFRLSDMQQGIGMASESIRAAMSPKGGMRSLSISGKGGGGSSQEEEGGRRGGGEEEGRSDE